MFISLNFKSSIICNRSSSKLLCWCMKGGDQEILNPQVSFLSGFESGFKKKSAFHPNLFVNSSAFSSSCFVYCFLVLGCFSCCTGNSPCPSCLSSSYRRCNVNLWEKYHIITANTQATLKLQIRTHFHM